MNFAGPALIPTHPRLPALPLLLPAASGDAEGALPLLQHSGSQLEARVEELEAAAAALPSRAELDQLQARPLVFLRDPAHLRIRLYAHVWALHACYLTVFHQESFAEHASILRSRCVPLTFRL